MPFLEKEFYSLLVRSLFVIIVSKKGFKEETKRDPERENKLQFGFCRVYVFI